MLRVDNLVHEPAIAISPTLKQPPSEIVDKVVSLAMSSVQAESKRSPAIPEKPSYVSLKPITEKVDAVSKEVSLVLGDKPKEEIDNALRDKIANEVTKQKAAESQGLQRGSRNRSLSSMLWMAAAVVAHIVAVAVLVAGATWGVSFIVIGIGFLFKAYCDNAMSEKYQQDNAQLLKYESLRKQASLDAVYLNFLKDRVNPEKYDLVSKNKQGSREELCYRMLNDPRLYETYRESINNHITKDKRETAVKFLETWISSVYHLHENEAFVQEKNKKAEIEADKRKQDAIERESKRKKAVESGDASLKELDQEDEQERMAEKLREMGFREKDVMNFCKSINCDTAMFMSEEDYYKLKRREDAEIHIEDFANINKLKNPIMIGGKSGEQHRFFRSIDKLVRGKS